MTTDYSSLLVEQRGAVRCVTLARPERRNAHDLHMFKELARAFDEADADDDCRCIVLGAQGDVFCAGQDLHFMKAASAKDKDEYGRWNIAVRQRIQRHAKPVVAAVNGAAVGGGAYLATACDLIVAAEDAYFQMREIGAGNHSGGAHLFSIGRARSLELNLLGRRVGAPEALEWGLINACVPAGELQDAVARYAQELCSLPPLAVRYTKAATNLLLDMAGYSAWLDAGAPMQRYLGLTEDGHEAKAAFRERREPVFTGRLPERSEMK
jgi:enoyl-CoA hydratase/carnithine racemase